VRQEYSLGRSPALAGWRPKELVPTTGLSSERAARIDGEQGSLAQIIRRSFRGGSIFCLYLGLRPAAAWPPPDSSPGYDPVAPSALKNTTFTNSSKKVYRSRKPSQKLLNYVPFGSNLHSQCLGDPLELPPDRSSIASAGIFPWIQQFYSASLYMLNVSSDQRHSVVECSCGD
jgi:hypothetical protein